MLCEAMRVTGLARGLSAGLARWRAPRAVHDPGRSSRTCGYGWPNDGPANRAVPLRLGGPLGLVTKKGSLTSGPGQFALLLKDVSN